MSRIIKAPNVKVDRPMRLLDRERTLRYLEDELQQVRKRAEAEGQEIVRQAETESERIVAEAQAQAEQIIAEAQAQAESIRETARQEGLQQGESTAHEQVRQEVAGLMGELAGMLGKARDKLQEIVFQQEREIRRLVAQIASKVVLKIVREDEETVARITRECIRRATHRQWLTILMHPRDKEKIERHCPEYRAAFDDLERIELREDPRVPQGGVIVETSSGGVDGRIHQQLAVIRETLVPDDASRALQQEARGPGQAVSKPSDVAMSETGEGSGGVD